MKSFLMKLVIAVCVVFSANHVLAADNQQPAMQHYVFTYNFEKQVSPMHYVNKEIEQQLRHMMVVEIQHQTHENLALMLTDEAMQENLLLAAASSEQNFLAVAE
jgi:hydrogenase maturation factor